MAAGNFPTAFTMEDSAIVVPTFNERENIPRLVETIFRLYPAIHLLIVDDHSPDGTSDCVRELQRIHPNLMLIERMRNPGFAPSYRDGFSLVLREPWCRAVISMDADFSHNPAVIAGMLERLAGHDVVIGSRYVKDGGTLNWSLRRRLLSRCANCYVNAILGMRISDATSGFVCMRSTALQGIPFRQSTSEGYTFLVELKYRFAHSGRKMDEIPIIFEERREGQSKMSMGKIWEAAWMPWRIRSVPGARAASAE